jgi:DNA-binding HxlR family transcriptional regulator
MFTSRFDIFADPWTYLALREVFFGVRRFDDIRRNVEISRNTLSDRLPELVQAGLLRKEAYQSNPIRHEYRLTQDGLDFYPAIIALMMWGDRWRSGPIKPLTLFARGTGARLKPMIVCQHCRNEVHGHDLVPIPVDGQPPETIGYTGVLRRSSASTSYTRGRPCSVAAALSVIGDRWSMRILKEAAFGARRFEDFVQGLGIARNILTARLDRFVHDGIFKKVAYREKPLRHEYRLTSAGEALMLPILMIMDWAARTEGSADPVSNGLQIRHQSCGHRLKPILIDQATQTPIEARHVTYKTSY